MISKRSRRNIRPVEPLNQFPITAAKGADGTKNADSLDTVQDLQNFDVTPSGDVELRKPMILQKNYSEDDARYVKVLYDSAYRLIVKNDNSIAIKNANGTSQVIRYVWYDYSTSEEYSSTSTPPETLLDFRNAQFINTNTATVITNIGVDLGSEFLKHDNEYVIYDPTLYEPKSPQYQPRTIQVFKSSTENGTFIVKINTPEINHLSNADTIELDANMALDNPYAIRDEYNSAAPNVKNILAYVDSEVSGTGDVIVSSEVGASSATEDSQTLSNVNSVSLVPESVNNLVTSVSLEPNPSGYYIPAFQTLGALIRQVFRTFVKVALSVSHTNSIPRRAIDSFTASFTASDVDLAKNIPVWVFLYNESQDRAYTHLYTLDVTLKDVSDAEYTSGFLSRIDYDAEVTRTYRGTYMYGSGQSYCPWDPRYGNTIGTGDVERSYDDEFSNNTNPKTVLPPSGKVCLDVVGRVLSACTAGTGGVWVGTSNGFANRLSRCIVSTPALQEDTAYTGLGYTCEAEQLGNYSVLKVDTGTTSARYCIGYPIRWQDRAALHTCIANKTNTTCATVSPKIVLRSDGDHPQKELLSASWSPELDVNRDYPFSSEQNIVAPAYLF